MPYEYSNPSRESESHALPDVEVFESFFDGETMEPLGPGSIGVFHTAHENGEPRGFFYAFGFPGCLWDSDPVGPFDTYELALADAREGVSCD